MRKPWRGARGNRLRTNREGSWHAPISVVWNASVGGEDLGGGLGSSICLGVFAVPLDEGADIPFELAGGGVDATPQLFAGELLRTSARLG